MTRDQHFTVILAASDSALPAKLSALRPEITVLPVGADIPSGTIEGSLFYFVDWLLPDMSGLEMCRRLRQAPATAHAHITLAVEADDIEARRRALRAGADDYLPGELDAPRLSERLIRCRVVAPTSQSALGHGDLTVNTSAFQVRWRGQLVPLGPTEFRILVYFLNNPDRVVSRTSLISEIGKDGAAIDERTVSVWIGRLRRALIAQGAPGLLRTIVAQGYILDSGPTPASFAKIRACWG